MLRIVNAEADVYLHAAAPLARPQEGGYVMVAIDG